MSEFVIDRTGKGLVPEQPVHQLFEGIGFVPIYFTAALG